MSSLNKTQITTASKLRQDRPAVLPGTNVILDTAAREEWYSRVTAQMNATGATLPRQVHEFCDLAGVPN
jgi:hypothetical protein